MGFLVILISFLQLSFFLIEVFQEFKAGGQINRLYTLVYRHLSGPLPRRALGNITLPQGGGDRGPIARRGGAILGILLRSPQEALRAALGHPSDGCRSRTKGMCPQYIVSTIPKALPPQGFISLTNLSCSTFTPYSPLPISPLISC